MGKLSIRKKGIGSEARAVRIVNADTDLQLLNNSERERLLQKQKKRRLKGREDDVCYHFSYPSVPILALFLSCTFIYAAWYCKESVSSSAPIIVLNIVKVC